MTGALLCRSRCFVQFSDWSLSDDDAAQRPDGACVTRAHAYALSHIREYSSLSHAHDPLHGFLRGAASPPLGCLLSALLSAEVTDDKSHHATHSSSGVSSSSRAQTTVTFCVFSSSFTASFCSVI